MKTLLDLKEAELIPTNSPLDGLLGGGIEKGCITQFYGPPGSGKTNFTLQILYELTKNGSKAVFIDTEGGLSIERIKQMAGSDFERMASNVFLIEPRSFDEQLNNINQLEELLKSDESIELLIIDSMVALYRVDDENISDLNKNLGRIMAQLLKYSRVYNIAIIITNQIYSPFDTDEEIIEPIGGTVLKYWSKVIVELNKDLYDNRNAILKRHKTKNFNESVSFTITDNGIR